MPRTYKPSRKKNYKKYEDLIMEQALEEYNATDKSLSQIAEKYHISKSVLHRHNTFIMKKQGGQPALSKDVEEYMIQYINVCSEWGYPLETIDLRLIIKGYLDRTGQDVRRFPDNMPGPDFVKSFLKRHKEEITVRLSQNIKRSRAAVSPETVEKYFDELEISLKDVPLCNIINYDETNLSDDPGRKKVLVKRSVKYPERVMNHSKTSTSLMMACAADGTLLPPYVVYKAQHIYDTWILNGPKGSRYNRTASGWFDGHTFEDWVKKIIIPYFKDKSGPKILIGDNLSSHLSIDLIKECKGQGIAFIFLPANSTHLTQPLDVAFFRPMKMAWREILYNWKKSDGRMQATIPKNIFPSLLKKLLTRLETNVSQNIISGFEKCGISPLNRNKVLDRLPNQTMRVDNDYKEAIDQTIVTMLKEMRYGTGSSKTSNKKKKIDVIAGRSVSVDETQESDESNTAGIVIEHDVSDLSSVDEDEKAQTLKTYETSSINKKEEKKEPKPNKKSLIKKTKDQTLKIDEGSVINEREIEKNINDPGPSNIRQSKTNNKSLIKKTKDQNLKIDGGSVINEREIEKHINDPGPSNILQSKTNNKSIIKKTKDQKLETGGRGLINKKEIEKKRNKPGSTEQPNTDKILIKTKDQTLKTDDADSSQIKKVPPADNNSKRITKITKLKRNRKEDILDDEKHCKETLKIETVERKRQKIENENSNKSEEKHKDETIFKKPLPMIIVRKKNLEKLKTIETMEIKTTDVAKNNVCDNIEESININDDFFPEIDDSIIQMCDRESYDLCNILDMDIENMPVIFGDDSVCDEIEIKTSLNEEKEMSKVHENKLELKEKLDNNEANRNSPNVKLRIISNETLPSREQPRVTLGELRKVGLHDKIKRPRSKYYRSDDDILKDLMDDNVI